METLRFLTEEQVREARARFGTPVFVYDQNTLETRAKEALAFPNKYGLTVRYAMKALPTAAILQVLTRAGLHLDASSGYEAARAIKVGIDGQRIQLTAQEFADNLELFVNNGVRFNACSLEQLAAYGKLFPGTEVSVRINPGLGSGSTNRTNVGGPSSSFGIWHEKLDDVSAIAAAHHLRITRMHTHIGSGSDPDVWLRCARLSLDIASRLPEVKILNLGGGFKIGRMEGEPFSNLQAIGNKILPEFEVFAKRYQRQLHLEIEPGTYFVANAGALICTAADLVDTGSNGYKFIKVDGGMTELLRPSLYGAQHPIISVSDSPRANRASEKYLVVGHCCESGDLFTPEPGNPEQVSPRELHETKVGDIIVIEGAGAYAASMASKNYNSFPECPEVLLTNEGELKLIRQRQTLDQIMQNELF